MPGKPHRNGITLIELTEMFPSEQSAIDWFESIQWPEQRTCGKCGSTETKEVPNAKPMPYWCHSCQSYFSVKTGTSLARSNVPMRKWAFAVYLYVTNIKGISSMRLHRELGVTQKTAWFMLHRLREGWIEAGLPPMAGPVEVDETYIGGKEKNKHAHQKLHATGPVGKKAVVGVLDRKTHEVRAEVVEQTDGATLKGVVNRHARQGATVFTDDNPGYNGVRHRHYSVCHSAKQYVNGEVHTNGIESFWSMLKRGYYGTFHHLSEKHLQRYVSEFAGRTRVREHDTADQMSHLVASLAGKQLLYRDLVRERPAA